MAERGSFTGDLRELLRELPGWTLIIGLLALIGAVALSCAGAGAWLEPLAPGETLPPAVQLLITAINAISGAPCVGLFVFLLIGPRQVHRLAQRAAERGFMTPWGGVAPVQMPTGSSTPDLPLPAPSRQEETHV